MPHGFLVELAFVVQILRGLLVAPRYSSDMPPEFASVQHILRKVSYEKRFIFLNAKGASRVYLLIEDFSRPFSRSLLQTRVNPISCFSKAIC